MPYIFSQMEQNIRIVDNFYSAFKHGDYKTMQQCYHPEVEFSDEVFPMLKGNDAMAMWHMLVEGARNSKLQINYANILAVDDRVKCDWEAHYILSLTERKVHNQIHASFKFLDGLIYRHNDRFDFYRWTRMAFGFKGVVLGWTPWFRDRVRKTVATRLHKFIINHPEYSAKAS
jgi:limonene-1,2-epoxide hydrolase